MFTRFGAKAVYVAGSQARNYATLREIETRLKSIKNIEKITNTMKVVASTRLNKAQRAMTTSRVYTSGEKEFYENAETAASTSESPKALIISVSSDKGLCGSIHSQIAKATRLQLKEYPDADIVAVGEKIKSQLTRTHPENLILAISGVGKETPNFTEATLIADEILKETKGKTYDNIQILYNKFVSGVSFEATAKPAFTPESVSNSPKLTLFELDADSNIPASFSEFSLANGIYSAMAEGYASEVSARRNAMDNASKNAGDMISKYSILYNRTRQAVITNELVDIITGASSLD
ncbi:F1F0 ATP synthase subunit gamma [Ascoidea rubescens DSM 1968]|uniref:ATP synthase subunit gamma n=1 Tax=Ascoidea rubescens DSM 1968 TaxID=1344418 RepID=A0A1D2VF98_9ASCO|nr:ATP synthase F1 gamma [Ascoidea rubescens DSM 1968]ODV60295.1 ATP synthase F1 gamma [Ascoidea rubescens DSM 1968]